MNTPCPTRESSSCFSSPNTVRVLCVRTVLFYVSRLIITGQTEFYRETTVFIVIAQRIHVVDIGELEKNGQNRKQNLINA